MYCPRCATQNNEGTRFCRSCGANLSLVPQALSGQLNDTRSNTHPGKPGEEPLSLTNGITKAFMGAGFLFVALFLVFTRQWWGIFMLIPGFFLLGRGIAEIVGSKQLNAQPGAARPPLSSPAIYTDEIQSPTTGKLGPPPSITETTTRHLDQRDTAGQDTR